MRGIEHIARLLGLGRKQIASQDRRASQRVTINLPVRVTGENDCANGACIARNVSEGGMLVTPNLTGDRGRRVRVDPGQGAEAVTARIVGQRPEGTGLAFLAGEEGRALAHWMVERAHGGGA
ncbi:PilZ domain-containing protein [Minwuia thermotolerans]|uniref:PilZ domain-containing protein n=1 Tax=Minwuia thermotolerans TaxID=2056226 RepID=A0A2M9G021_9PROT|nr:PilZ domain-containing protein [Minwuia thermotolerans]PJK29060.1 hypothetical protein CVT23_14170 [Minwuia thermotolerans]